MVCNVSRETPAYINYLPLYGRGALINIVIAPRNVGKTFTAKLWGLKRFLKTGSKIIWVRRTDEETQAAKKKYFHKKLLKICGLRPDQVMIKGSYGYVKQGKRWVDCVEFCSLSTATTQRSVDDDAYNLMFVDEAFATPAKVAAFRGDEVREFLDLFVSKRRDHKLTAFLLGNRETIDNPYFAYFGITPPSCDLESVTTYNNGTLAVWVAPHMKAPSNSADKLEQLLAGTTYGAYMYQGKAKNAPRESYASIPPRASCYASIDLGKPFSIYTKGGAYYVGAGVDGSRYVFVSRGTLRLYKRPVLYTANRKHLLSALTCALQQGRVHYVNEAVAETAIAAFERMGLYK